MSRKDKPKLKANTSVIRLQFKWEIAWYIINIHKRNGGIERWQLINFLLNNTRG
jgi:hypothetical protein